MFDLRENAFGDPPNISMIPSYGYVCEDNKLLYVSKLTDGTNVYRIAGVVDGKLDWIDILVEDPAQNACFRSPVGGGNYKKNPITKEEFDQALNACVPVEIEMTPLTQFPMD